MTITQAFHTWLGTCPSVTGRLDVDGTAPDALTLSVDSVPCREVLRRYRDGGTLRQAQFSLSSRRFLDSNTAQSLQNLQFFDNIRQWIESTATLPSLGSGKKSRRVLITGSPAPVTVAPDGTARYEMELRLEYFQGGEAN